MDDRLRITTDLTIAWLSNPNTNADLGDITAFLSSAHAALAGLGQDGGGDAIDTAPTQYVRAISVRQSLASPDHIISMINGKPYSVLRRHLASHGLTPEEYRLRYGLKSDYPMVAPAMSEKRRAIANQIGLGRSHGKMRASEAPVEPVVEAPKRRKLKLSI